MDHALNPAVMTEITGRPDLQAISEDAAARGYVGPEHPAPRMRGNKGAALVA